MGVLAWGHSGVPCLVHRHPGLELASGITTFSVVISWTFLMKINHCFYLTSSLDECSLSKRKSRLILAEIAGSCHQSSIVNLAHLGSPRTSLHLVKSSDSLLRGGCQLLGLIFSFNITFLWLQHACWMFTACHFVISYFIKLGTMFAIWKILPAAHSPQYPLMFNFPTFQTADFPL